MKAECIANEASGSLICSIPDADWYFTIRHIDGRILGTFSDFHMKEMEGIDIATRYLPHWKALFWTKIHRGALGKSESFARDVEFKIIVHSTDKGSKTHNEIVEAFLDFMRGAQ